MSIYVYNSIISTNTYETGDFGSITSPVERSIDYAADLSLQPQSVVDYTTNFYLTRPLPGSATEFSSTDVTFDSAPHFDSTSINFSSLTDSPTLYDSSTPYETVDEVYTFDSTVYEDFGYLYVNSTLTPMGALEIKLTSAAVSQLHHFTGSGTLFTVGVLDENVTFAWVGNGTVFEIGSGLERTVRPYVASGTLRMDASVAATALERVSWAYNTSSIYNPQLDWGSITEAGLSGIDDFGSITEPPTIRGPYPSLDDFGLIINNPTSYPQIPFGTVRFVNYNADNTYDTCDSNGISCDNQSSATISFTAQTPEDTALYTFLGVGLESHTESYVGIGALTLSGTALESFSAQTPEDTALYTFLGTALESFSAQTPEDTVLYSFSGELLHPNIDYTPHYGIEKNIGVGTTGIKLFGELLHPNIDYTPHYGIEKNIGVGTTGIKLNGVLTERFTFSYNADPESCYDPGEDATDFGFVSETPSDFIDSGLISEEETGNIPDDAGFIIEPLVVTCPFGSIFVLGTALESFSAQTPEDTVLYSFSGELLHPNIDYTPHYGIEKNIGVGTTGINLSGYAVEKNTESYVGIGTLTLSGTALESFSAQTPEDTILYSFSGTALESFSAQTPEDTALYTFLGTAVERNTESYAGIGTFGPVPGVGFAPDGDGNLRDAKTYCNRYGFLIGDFNLGSGIGTIRLLGSGKGRLVPVIFGQGSIFISGTGNESFSRCNYDGSGEIITLSGIASTREIAVYGYYGDDNNPGTSGTIFVSQQTSPIIEKITFAYSGSGQLSVNGSFDILRTKSFRGLGTVQFYGTALESFSAQTPEDIQLFSISGFSLEVYSAQTPETEVLYIINGFIEESITNSYEGLGSVSLTGDSTVFYVPNYPARGTFRFTRHNVDNDYDTCDNEDIVCDNQDSAHVSFTANPPENTVLLDLDGSAVTSEISVYTDIGVGLYTLSGTYNDIKLTYSEIGIGTVFISEISSERETNTYIGNGNLFTLSGSGESIGVIPPENTLLIQISGSATTSIELEYSIVGIGLFTVSGSAITSEIATYTQIGSGTITLSGELLHPDVDYIPSLGGSGLINVLGSADDSITKIYDIASGSLFGFSSGLESFTKSTYVGLGTIYILELSGLAINNPFQIPRTYVVII